MSPCDGRGASATRRDLLAGCPIEIRSEPVELHPRSPPERDDGRLGAYESMPTQRGKLADRDAIPGHHERLALVKLAHNLAAVIAQLPLSDLFGHTTSVARVLRPPRTLPITSNGRRGTGDSGSGVDVPATRAEADSTS